MEHKKTPKTDTIVCNVFDELEKEEEPGLVEGRKEEGRKVSR